MTDTFIFQVTIEAGAELVRALDSRGLPPELAAWYFDINREEWRFLLQFDASREKHPTLMEIARLMAVRDDIAEALCIGDIAVVEPDDDMAIALRSSVRTGPQVTQKPFGLIYKNGTYVKRGLAYRSLAPQAQPAQ